MLVSVGLVIGTVALSYIMINKYDDAAVNTRSDPLIFSPSNLDNFELLLNVENYDIPAVLQFELTLRNILEEHNVVVRNWTTGGVDELLAIEEANITHYHERICGAIQLEGDVDGVRVRLMFPGNWMHGSASLVNLLDNVLERLGGNRAEVVTFNAPILKKEQQLSRSVNFEIYKTLMAFGKYTFSELIHY